MRKLRADIIPYSSAVGGGVSLRDERGIYAGQLTLLNGSDRFTRDQFISLCTQLKNLVNKDGGLRLYADDEPVQFRDE